MTTKKTITRSELKKLTPDEKHYLSAKIKYYDGDPIISDAEFDILEDKLKQLGSWLVNIVGKPNIEPRPPKKTKRKVASLFDIDAHKEKNKKYNHPTRVLSLDKIITIDNKTPNIEDAVKWFNDISCSSVVTEPKYDGNAVNVIYNDGELERVLTRGDEGIQGTDVTSKLAWQLPEMLDIDIDIDIVEIRGEVLMPVALFNRKYLNKVHGTATQKYRNPRNLVAGILAKDNPDPDMVKDLVFIPYEIRMQKAGQILNFPEVYEFCEHQKFPHLPDSKTIKTSLSAFESIFKMWLNYRTTSKYALDGFVMKVMDSKKRSKLGETNHHPRWAIAVKFEPEFTKTIIEDIEWKVGKTGELSPVGILTPVDLDGTTVSRASLHNVNYIIKNKTYIGAEVAIAKKGDVIPQVMSVISPAKTPVGIIDKCPDCGFDLYKDDSHLMCTNLNCPGMMFYRFRYGVNSLKMDFFGDATLKQIFENMNINSAFDLFDDVIFNKETLIDLGKFPDGKNVDRLIAQIRNKHDISMQQCLLMLGIPKLGKSVTKELAKMISNLPYSDHGLEKIFFELYKPQTPEYTSFVAKVKILKELGINVTLPKEDVGIKFEMTGSPKSYGFKTKKNFIEYANKFGFINSKLTNDCKYLITDNIHSGSKKMVKAEKLGVESITYDEFIKKHGD